MHHHFSVHLPFDSLRLCCSHLPNLPVLPSVGHGHGTLLRQLFTAIPPKFHLLSFSHKPSGGWPRKASDQTGWVRGNMWESTLLIGYRCTWFRYPIVEKKQILHVGENAEDVIKICRNKVFNPFTFGLTSPQCHTIIHLTPLGNQSPKGLWMLAAAFSRNGFICKKPWT